MQTIVILNINSSLHHSSSRDSMEGDLEEVREDLEDILIKVKITTVIPTMDLTASETLLIRCSIETIMRDLLGIMVRFKHLKHIPITTTINSNNSL